ncbi:hypothetical protein GF373_17870, partial [bacterium]|nr:hypothetical protein [bacterium]
MAFARGKVNPFSGAWKENEGTKLDTSGMAQETNFSAFNRWKTMDEIIISLPGNVKFNQNDINIGPQDHFSLNNGLLILSENVTLHEGTRITVNGKIRSSNTVKINTDHIRMDGWFEIGGDTLFELTDVVGCVIKDRNTSPSPNMIGVYIEGGGGHTIETYANSCRQYGVFLNDTDCNTIRGTVSNCQMAGLNVYKSNDNKIELTIKQCQTGAIFEHSHSNTMPYCTITNSTDHGIKLTSSSSNRFENVNIVDNGSHGVFLAENSNANQFISTVFRNNSDAGALIDHAANNQFSDCRLSRQLNGIVIDGGEGNTLTNCLFAEAFSNKEAFSIAGHGQYGIWLKNGAFNNTVQGCRLYTCGSHAVLIEGQNTSGNRIDSCKIGGYLHAIHESYEMTHVSTEALSNGGDGIRLQNGANFNQVSYCSITQCENGISLDGSNISDNAIFSNYLGCIASDDEFEYALNSNREWGILLEKQQNTTYIRDCVFGGNERGGVKIMNSDATGTAGRTIFEDCRFGYVYDFFTAYSPYHKMIGYAGEYGIYASNTESIEIKNSRFNCADYNLAFEDCKQINLVGLMLDNAYQNNIQIDQSSHAVLSQIRCLGSENTAIDIQSSEACYLDTVHIEESTSGGGVAISNSKSIHLDECVIEKCDLHGISITNNADTVTVKNGGFSEFGMDGIYIENSQNIDLYGDMPYYEFSLSIANRNGITIKNSQHINIGHTGRGINISNCEADGILIKGEDTNDVKIVGNMIIMQRKGNNINVESGSNIEIGTSEMYDRNSIEFCNNAGVLIGPDAHNVSVVNNLIGESPGIDDPSRDYSCEEGVLLEEGVSNAFISDNIIYANRSYGIHLKEDCTANVIRQNLLLNNGDNAIQVDGDASSNLITLNRFQDNEGDTLSLNHPLLTAPTLFVPRVTNAPIKGSAPDAPDGSIVMLYASKTNAGWQLIDKTHVTDHSFSFQNTHDRDMQLMAKVMAPNGNTSNFGDAVNNLSRESSLADSFVFTVTENNLSSIYYQSPSSLVPAPLIENEANNQAFCFTSDRTGLVFTSDEGGNRDIYLHDFSSKESTPLIKSDSDDYDPDWGDSHSVVFVSERDGNPELYLLRQNSGSGLETLAYHEGEYSDDVSFNVIRGSGVHFSVAEGSLLSRFDFYIASEPDEFEWKILPFTFDGRNTFPQESSPLLSGKATPQETGWFSVTIEPTAMPSDFVIAFYPLQNNIPVLGKTGSGAFDRWWAYYGDDTWYPKIIDPYMITAHFGEAMEAAVMRLTETQASEHHPKISPDGSAIVYTRKENNSSQIWLMDMDGFNPRVLVDNTATNEQPCWTPDGSSII